jgi:Xaa-Pro aminopeptidase
MAMERINRFIETFGAHDIDAYLVTSYENRRYLSGFSGSNATLFISPNKRELLTDFRYDEQSRKQAPDFVVTIINQFVSNADKLNALCDEENVKRIGFESDQVTVSWLEKTRREMPGIEFVPCPGVIEELRTIKDVGEIENITKAQATTDEAFMRILEFIEPGTSEIEIAAELVYYMSQNGCKPAFDTIVASGPNGSMPHAVPSERVVKNGDFVTMDFGAVNNGYCSDMTRTVAVGEPSPEMIDVYNIVLEAQHRALELIKPGVSCKLIDAAARDLITEKGFGDYFGHGLGHSFGLFIHEEPRFSPSSEATTEPGICISVEPGIYLPQKFGVRIEDTVCITNDGYQNFTRSPKELIIL